MNLNCINLTLWLACFSLTNGAIAIAKEIKVAGTVTDNTRTPIPGVTIRAEKDGKPLAKPFITGASGEYTMTINGNDDFDLIYTVSACHPAVIQKLSAEKHHSINKVLYRLDSDSKSLGAGLSVINAYEYLGLAALNSGQIKSAKVAHSEGISIITSQAFEIKDDDAKRYIRAKQDLLLILWQNK